MPESFESPTGNPRVGISGDPSLSDLVTERIEALGRRRRHRLRGADDDLDEAIRLFARVPHERGDVKRFVVAMSPISKPTVYKLLRAEEDRLKGSSDPQGR